MHIHLYICISLEASRHVRSGHSGTSHLTGSKSGSVDRDLEQHAGARKVDGQKRSDAGPTRPTTSPFGGNGGNAPSVVPDRDECVLGRRLLASTSSNRRYETKSKRQGVRDAAYSQRHTIGRRAWTRRGGHLCYLLNGENMHDRDLRQTQNFVGASDWIHRQARLRGGCTTPTQDAIHMRPLHRQVH